LEGFFAAGEDAGGVHGGNRLGGNGVADSIVFGARAGDAMAQYVTRTSDPLYSATQAKELCDRAVRPLGRVDGENPFRVREALESLMWRKVGVVRNGKDLESAIPELQELRCKAAATEGSGGA